MTDPWECPTCGAQSDRCYRCTECGADMAGEHGRDSAGGGRDV